MGDPAIQQGLSMGFAAFSGLSLMHLEALKVAFRPCFCGKCDGGEKIVLDISERMGSEEFSKHTGLSPVQLAGLGFNRTNAGVCTLGIQMHAVNRMLTRAPTTALIGGS